MARAARGEQSPSEGPLKTTLTDVVAQRILDELQHHKAWIDRMPDIRTLTIDVKFNKETGLPRCVVVRAESER